MHRGGPGGQTDLGLCVIAGLSEEALDRLAALLAPLLGQPASCEMPPSRATTVNGLAREVGMTPRAVRAAIDRGDLPAVKRAGRWLISREGVEHWLAPPPTAPRPIRASRPARRTRPTPMADAVAQIRGRA